jgi:hypothetical protein
MSDWYWGRDDERRYRTERDDGRRGGWRNEDERRSFGGGSDGGDYPRDAYGGSASRAYEGGAYRGRYGEDAYGGGTRQGYRGAYGDARYGERYGGYSSQGYGRQRSEFDAEPEQVQRVSDGDYDHPRFFGGRHEGEHRGRGPKNYKRSDERIREDVNDRLADDSWLDASQIEVAVADCEVTLSGAVTRREDKRRAEDIAEHVSGVTHVQNNLRLQAQDEKTARSAGLAPGDGAVRTTSASVQ